LCGTWPSGRRTEHDGEWPFISAVHSGPVKEVPEALQHDFSVLLGKSSPILAGAVSSHFNVAALLENTGNLLLFSLTSEPGWGIRPSDSHKVIKKAVSRHDTSLKSSTSVRFCFINDTHYLFAIDVQGKICRKEFKRL
jgi:hypothetical protein